MQLHAIILAAGKGKRIGSKTLPKVMLQLAGKPVLSYVLETIRELGIRDPIIVVGFRGKKIIDAFPNYRYVWQKKRLGTAHAALQVRSFLERLPGYTFILYGDNPLLSVDTLKRIIQEVENKKAIVGLSVAQAPDELELGIVVTDPKMHIKEIVEQKVATAELGKTHRWRNTGSWLVDNQWLWQALPKIRKHPKSGEYYLTDLAYLAKKLGHTAVAVPVADPAEAVGINTSEHLKEAEKWLRIKPKR